MCKAVCLHFLILLDTYAIDLAMKSVFEPYRDLKDNLHKELTAKLLATDTVIKQSMTQIFRSKVCVSPKLCFHHNKIVCVDDDRLVE
jgi:hypothetical protein